MAAAASGTPVTTRPLSNRQMKAAPEAVFAVLISKIGGLLERLIVIDAEHAGNIGRALENQASDFGREIAGAGVAEGGCRP